MAKNSTLADLDAFLKEQETTSNPTKETESSYTKEEFVSRNPHQIIETEILAQVEKTEKNKRDTAGANTVQRQGAGARTEAKIDTTVEIKTEKKNVAQNHINDIVPPVKKTESAMVQWSKAIDETVKGSEMLRSVPLLSDITESSTEQLKATEKFFETSQNIWKKFWR